MREGRTEEGPPGDEVPCSRHSPSKLDSSDCSAPVAAADRSAPPVFTGHGAAEKQACEPSSEGTSPTSHVAAGTATAGQVRRKGSSHLGRDQEAPAGSKTEAPVRLNAEALAALNTVGSISDPRPVCHLLIASARHVLVAAACHARCSILPARTRFISGAFPPRGIVLLTLDVVCCCSKSMVQWHGKWLSLTPTRRRPSRCLSSVSPPLLLPCCHPCPSHKGGTQHMHAHPLLPKQLPRAYLIARLSFASNALPGWVTIRAAPCTMRFLRGHLTT